MLQAMPVFSRLIADGMQVAHLPITANRLSSKEVSRMGTMAPAAQKKRHRILVIEGDAGARRVISATLKEAGYLVTEADTSDHAAALLSLDLRPRAVGAILCDIRTPKINDCEATVYFRARYPAIPVIVTSFYPDIEWAIALMNRAPPII